MTKLAERLSSGDFAHIAHIARHRDFPRAFSRSRSLPLSELIGVMLSMRNQSQQAMLNGFFTSVCSSPTVLREVSGRAFAKAWDRLHRPALVSLNDLVVRRAEEAGLIERWRGLRVVVGDAPVLMPALRPCLLERSAAAGDQPLIALYLLRAELTLHACVHSALVADRSMLVEALDRLGPDDVLVLDRGYPAAWLVALIMARGIRFVMRCDNDTGCAEGETFMRSSRD